MESTQHPIGSGFGPAHTAADVIRGIDLHGRIAVVTGGASGMGLEITRALVGAGAEVIVAARSPQAAGAALAGLPRVSVEALDLQDPVSIDAFAARVLATCRPLHILVNNTGLVAAELKRDARGYEELFATNHLGHFQLTLRLWPALLAAHGARVVSVSSRGHQVAGIDFGDPNFLHRPYDKWVAYGQSKTANALFAVGVDARGERDGIRAFSLHPGAVMTGLARNMTQAEVAAFGMFDEQGRVRNDPERDFKSIEQGAATAIWCATSPRLEGIGGVYCENSDVAPLVETAPPMTPGVRPWAVDRTFADRLWTLSEQLTDCSIPTC